MSAIDDEIVACHEAAGVTEQEERCPLEFGRLGETAHWTATNACQLVFQERIDGCSFVDGRTHILSLPFLPQPRNLFEVLEHHGRQDVARADTIDTDASRAVLSNGTPFHREIAG